MPALRRPSAIALPADSSLSASYATASFADAFAINVPRSELDAMQYAHWVLTNSPVWLKGLLALRDLMVAPLGIKTSSALQRQLDGGEALHIGFFRVLSHAPDEVVVGERDRHLDFTSSLLVRRRVNGGEDQVVATTVVACNNLSGKLYIRAIEPFHKLVVTAGLANARKHCV